MYIPAYSAVTDQEQLVAFMQAHNFATLVSQVEGELFATHLPLIITQRNEQILLQGHLAKANAHWRGWQTHPDVLVIFQGPHAYISPTYYAKQESVPTWNYAAVHAYGRVQVTEEAAAKEAALAALIAQHEASYQTQWASLPAHFREGMLKGIVAFAIPVTRLEGKYKLSQNRPAEDQARIIHGLSAAHDTAISGVAELMQAQLAP
ncbi:MAG: FMN-binding negative transcriptional regulator [Caldilineaceae bacterium]